MISEMIALSAVERYHLPEVFASSLSGTSWRHSGTVFCNRPHGYDLCNIGTQHDIKLTPFVTRKCDSKS